MKLVAPADISLWTGPRIAFWIIGALVIGGALLTVTRRNPVSSVMSLVATFFGLAATYALLSAHFLAALQVLVYAGAIMVLFIFVVMVLNRDEGEPVAWNSAFSKLVGAGAAIYLVGWKLAPILLAVVPAHSEAPPADFGTVENVGTILFTDYLFPFEAISILLLIAVIAAVVVARAHRPPEEKGAPPSESRS
jgi:NADH-quinone oxidoreductase subunit J